MRINSRKIRKILERVRTAPKRILKSFGTHEPLDASAWMQHSLNHLFNFRKTNKGFPYTIFPLKKINVENVLKLWENCYLINLFIHILKLEISGCDNCTNKRYMHLFSFITNLSEKLQKVIFFMECGVFFWTEGGSMLSLNLEIRFTFRIVWLGTNMESLDFLAPREDCTRLLCSQIKPEPLYIERTNKGEKRCASVGLGDGRGRSVVAQAMTAATAKAARLTLTSSWPWGANAERTIYSQAL
jgi:hypothetical protein